MTQRHIKLSLETSKKGGAQKHFDKCLTLRIRHNEVIPKEVKLAIIYNIENSRVNSNLRVFPIFRTVNLSFLLFKVRKRRKRRPQDENL